MSWSFSAIGKPGAVAKKAEVDLTSYKCTDPEEGVKVAALGVLKTALEAQDADSVVQVDASGSQSTVYDKDGSTKKFTNSLSVVVKPVYGFVE